MNKAGTPDMLERLKKVDHLLAASVRIICSTLLSLLVITVSISVFTRFVVFYPLNFADALAKYLMMWMAFLGVGLALREGEHIGVDLFTDRLPDGARQVVTVLIALVIATFLAPVIYYGFLNAWSGKESSDPLVFGISMMIPYLSVPVGAFYALVQLVITTWIRLLDIGKEANA